jgi:hypothetical protein
MLKPLVPKPLTGNAVLYQAESLIISLLYRWQQRLNTYYVPGDLGTWQ